MLSIVLTVLKIIGIVLLSVLGVVLLLLLLILFVPIRYRIDGNIPETLLEDGIDPKSIWARVKFSWLLHIISGGLEYPDKMEFTLKIFGIRILPKKVKEKKKKADKKDKESSADDQESEGEGKAEDTLMVTEAEDNWGDSGSETSAEADVDTASESEIASDTESDTNAENTSEIEIETGTETHTDTDTDTDTDSNVDDLDEEEDSDKRSFIEVLSDIFIKIQNILKMPQDVLQKIQYTTSRLCDKIEMIKVTLESDIFKRAFALCKGKLVRLIKMILPDKSDIDLLFGAGDPATTADIMGAYGCLYPILYNKLSYTPDFERGVVRLDAHMKGHITIFTIVYCAAVCYFNKDVKKVIARFKKIKNS
ncbi:hypothetical protein [Butyrivibrio proteoclasticus]|uniref:hypothetical protein n=1 Tax=Butyrivibrio proteoclasticus TaxID=43305 RepID=UPI00047C9062|nr:hypothetical protein [Butyrivibrio proteoclasticus]